MKKLNSVFSLVFAIMLFTSCSSDDNNTDAVGEVQLEEAMVQNGPWTFHHYEMINLVNAGNSTMTQVQIEGDMNLQQEGLTLVFNANGTGETVFEDEEGESWTWSIENGNDLKILYDDTVSDTYSNLSIINGKLKMEAESVTYDSTANLEVFHYGRLVFE